MSAEYTRRVFLKSAAALSGVIFAGGCNETALRPKHPRRSIELKLGLASYSVRKFSLDETLEMMQRLNLKYVKLKSMHLPLDSKPKDIEKAAAKINSAGIRLYGGGVIYMSSEEQVHQAFDYAKNARLEVIVGVPSYRLLDLVNKKVQEYDIKLAIHNHGPGDRQYPTPAVVHEKIKDLDRRIGLCNDIGHTKRSGIDPAKSILDFADRTYDVDLKDVSKASPEGESVEIGRGVIDIPKIIGLLKKIQYRGVMAIEYEKNAGDPIAGLAESVGYVRALMKTTPRAT